MRSLMIAITGGLLVALWGYAVDGLGGWSTNHMENFAVGATCCALWMFFDRMPPGPPMAPSGD